MTAASSQITNLNDARSTATRERLVTSTIESLIAIGFTKTTGVEVCRRANLTRGALNHHFPDFVELLVETLQTLYRQLLALQLQADVGPLELITLQGHHRVIQPEFKAVVELWLASRNDAQIGERLALAIEQSSMLFTPEMVLVGVHKTKRSEAFDATYRTIFEALIGIGLGRAVSHGDPLAHESMVLGVLTRLARQYDQER